MFKLHADLNFLWVSNAVLSFKIFLACIFFSSGFPGPLRFFCFKKYLLEF